MRARLGLVSLLLALPASGADDAEFQRLLAQVNRVTEGCRAAVQDKQFDPIRDKVQLFDETHPTNAPHRKPSPSEARALKALYAERVRCNSAYQEVIGGAKPESPLFQDSYAHEQLSALTMLSEGYVTYVEYNKWRKEKADALTKDIQAKQARQAEEQKQAEAQQAILLLTCFADSPPEMRGVEFQYRIDLRTGSVSTNRGPGAPYDTRISESEIGFRQGSNQHVSISRISGSFSINSGPLITVGRCSRANSRTF